MPLFFNFSLYHQSLMKSCGGGNMDPSNLQECQENLQYYYKCISRIQTARILEPFCAFASPKQPEMLGGRRRSLTHHKLLDPEPPIPEFGCRTYGFLLSHYWANDDKVRRALRVRKGRIREWQRWSYGLPYTSNIPTSFQYHANLSTRSYRALIYSGDHDVVVPFLAAPAWIRSLNYPIVDAWWPWMLQGQVAGYARTYSNRMTFATIKGVGHTAPEKMPAECQAMFERWISEEPL